MSMNDPTAGPAGGAPGAPAAQGQPSEAELRAAYEAELSRITSAELMLQAAVSLLNVGSFRLAPRAPAAAAATADAAATPPSASQAPSPGDLEQARDAIDAVRALLEIIERRMPDETAPLRNALSQLQMIYAREAQAGGAGGEPGTGGPAGGGAPPAGGSSGGAQAPGGAPGEEQPPGPGPAESSGRLWVPGR
jgi:uncharacterized membrane protein YgcG